MGLFPAGRIEIAALHGLPQMLDAERIFANQQPGALFHGGRLAAFADADQPALGLDGDDIGGLVEGRLMDVGRPAASVGVL